MGSSITRTLASSEMALAISMICWSAMDRPSAMRVGSIGTPRRSNSLRASLTMVALLMSPKRPLGWRPMKMFSATLRSGKSVGSW